MKANRWEIENFVSKEFCDKIIKYSEAVGFEQATLATATGPAFRIKYRHNDRSTFHDEELADILL